MLRRLHFASLVSLVCLSATARAADEDWRLSSIGYVPAEAKRATLLGAPSGSFFVLRAEDQSEAFSGDLAARGGDGIADFSALTEEGSFVLEAPGVGRSPAFPIGVHAYVEPYRTAMLGFYAWRSGVDISVTYEGQTWSHAAGHLQDAYLDFVGQPGVIADGTGGWYDAGDYGKYIVNSALAMGLLLQAWEDFRENIEPIALQIPETGGSQPDYLHELRFQLDWMLKMQFEDGSVSHKLTPVTFAGHVQPAQDPSPRYFSPWGSAATAGFVATMAKAARVFRGFDASYADQLEAAALTSYDFLTANPSNHPANLSDFDQAQYQTDDGHLRVWAAAEVWETTGNASALDDFEARVGALRDKVSVDWDWGSQSNLGVFTYLRSQRSGKADNVAQTLEMALVAAADEHVAATESSSYGRGLDNVYWGSNGTVARICSTLHVAYELTDNETYLATCADQIGHLFGRNEYRRSQVTGVGIDPPLFPHDRRSDSDGIDPPFPGYLVGGASVSGNWTDETADYETNEIAINWQGALVYAIAAFVAAPDGPVAATGGAGGAGGETGSGVAGVSSGSAGADLGSSGGSVSSGGSPALGGAGTGEPDPGASGGTGASSAASGGAGATPAASGGTGAALSGSGGTTAAPSASGGSNAPAAGGSTPDSSSTGGDGALPLGSGGNAADAPASGASDDSGCGCRTAPGRPLGAWALLGLLSAFGLRRTRRL